MTARICTSGNATCVRGGGQWPSRWRIKRWNCIEIEGCNTHHAHAIYTNIYILQGTLQKRARPFATAMERNLGLIPVLFSTKKVKKKNNNCKKTILGSGSRFRSSSRSPVGEIAPVFVWQRVAFPNAKSFPPVGLFWAEHSLANINSLKVHSVR